MKEALEDALVWQRYAREDLHTAQMLIEQPDVVLRHPAWLAQQAAEKTLKAVLVAEQIPFPWTHDLERLSELIPSGWRAKHVAANLERLSEYAVEARYPGDLPDLSAHEVRLAVEDATRLVEAVQVDLDRMVSDS